jgi:hypothetical protein
MAIMKIDNVKEGDICEVTVKYRVLKVYDDGHCLVQKVYDIPATALRPTGENIQ